MANSFRLSFCFPIFAFILSVLVAKGGYADLSGNAEFSETEKVLASLIEEKHVRHLTIDDSLSEKIYHGFLKALDPKKIYFEAKDIVELDRFKTLLDDHAKQGKLEFPELVIRTYRERVRERVALIKELLALPEDFTKEESYSIDTDALVYASTALEIEARVQQDLKAKLLSLKLSDPKSTEEERKKKVLSFYEKELRRLEKWRDIDVLERYLKALTSAIDPHSIYLGAASAENLRTQMSLQLSGIGASLAEAEDGSLEVKELVEGGPAKLSGALNIGDKITGVSSNGEAESFVDIGSLTIDEAIKLIRGPKDTKVLLRVIPAKGGAAKEVQITRAQIKLQESRAVGVVKELQAKDGKAVRIGQIYLPAFYEDFADCRKNPKTCLSANNDLRDILTRADFKDIDLLMLDLRNDGGGSLSAATKIIELLCGKGPAVQVKTGNRVLALPPFPEEKQVYWGPMMVTINGASASASEIVAAALQDRGRALIVGSTTYGKGTVQGVMDVKPEGWKAIFSHAKGEVKLTIAEFFRLSGESTQERGVIPDVELPSLVSVLYPREAEQPNALRHSKIDATGFEVFGQVNPPLVALIQSRTEARQRQNEHFIALKKEVAEAVRQKAKKRVSLNEQTRRAEQARTGEDEAGGTFAEDAYPLVAASSTEKKASKENHFINDELQNIALDYLELRSPGKVPNDVAGH